jgi:hypothetical protein
MHHAYRSMIANTDFQMSSKSTRGGTILKARGIECSQATMSR